MTNLEYLKGIKDKEFKGIVDVEKRGVRALEIIAETLISIDRNLEYLTIPKIEIPKPEIHFMTKEGESK